MRKQDNYTFLTTAPIRRVIPAMAVPTIISMLVTSIYNLVDTYYVGLLNTQATAAVGVVFPVMAIIQSIGFLFGQGSGTYMSRHLGARRLDEARQMAATSFVGSIVWGLVITVLGLIFLKPLSIALGSTPTILPYTMKFMGVILLGAPLMTASMVINNQMRFQGNATQAMYGMISGAVLNVVLVPLFMFTFGLGILGTAIGTVLSQLFGFIVLWMMSRRGENIPIKLSQASNKWHYHQEILKGGTPSLTRQALASVATLMLNVAAGVYGDAAIAGMSIVSRLAFLIFAVIIGVGQGYQPFCGFNYGAGLHKRLLKGFYFTIALDMAVLLVLCGLCTSVMWGAIFNLAVEGLGKYTEAASGIFMMLVVGGGIMPFIQEFIAKAAGYMNSYWLVVAMLAYLLFYAVIGSKNVNKDIPVD